MRTLIFGLAALSTSAFAEPVEDSMYPHTKSFTYDWAPIPAATTTFTFTSTSTVTSGQCGNLNADLGLDYCHNGTFTTGNNGNGTFTTRVERYSCSTTNTGSIFGFYARIQECDNRQRLVATYQYSVPVVNPAVYNGTAELGTASRFRICFLTNSNCDNWRDWAYDLSFVTDFVGNLSGPSTGTFFEN